ncbi:hypothetical protein [Pseudonocardia sp. GCM10023141]|uniref:hypothetical protein n=1 Tax=Pseudonocardia sp. GCM10023141 TaxID=3252653 RepID=UPI003612E5CA
MPVALSMPVTMTVFMFTARNAGGLRVHGDLGWAICQRNRLGAIVVMGVAGRSSDLATMLV